MTKPGEFPWGFGSAPKVRSSKNGFAGRSEMLLEIDGPGSIDWVMPNADGAGYYRRNIGDEQSQHRSRGGQDTERRERVSFLGNLGALLEAVCGGDTYMKALGAFATDPEPFVVSAVISELDGVRDTFVSEDSPTNLPATCKRPCRLHWSVSESMRTR